MYREFKNLGMIVKALSAPESNNFIYPLKKCIFIINYWSLFRLKTHKQTFISVSTVC